jgi:MoaA/NifB/PqqE/SkfB family radical SAM enzyme
MSNLYTFETIRKLEIDITSFCNAFCGACDRNIDGGEPHPGLTMVHLNESTWRSLFTAKNLQHINEIIFNGNFGDFSMHPYIIDVLDHLNNVKPNLYINMHTNGAARNPAFWSQLAQVLCKFDKHDVKWGIDGLENNHNRYRRGLDWSKRMANLAAFNEAGGNSIWKSIVFDYNKDCLDDMEALARQLGCLAFQTNRNRSGDMTLKAYRSDIFADFITSPTLSEFTASYQRKVQFRNQGATPKTTAVDAHGVYPCPYAKEGMLQIDPWGYAWPCCYISGRKVDQNTNFPYTQFDSHVEHNTLPEILDTFRPFLEKSWKDSSLDVCNKCAGITQPSPKY